MPLNQKGHLRYHCLLDNASFMDALEETETVH